MIEIVKLNEQVNKSLHYLGYAKLTKMQADVFKEFKAKSLALVAETQKSYPNGKLFNLINANIDVKSKSNQMVDKYLVPTIKEHLYEEKTSVYPVSHIIKPFGIKSFIWHQDSSVVDESKDFSLNGWMTLVDSKCINGCLWILPGSHINTNHFRQFGFNLIDGKFLKHLRQYMKPIYSKAGEIVLFHRNLIHGSSSNWLPWNRIAVECLITPKNAQLFNYHRDENLVKDKILGFKVDSSHFLKENPKEDFYSGEVKYDLIDDMTKEDMIKNISNDIPRFIEHASKINL